MRRLALLLVLSAACTKVGTGNESPPGEPLQARPAVAPIPVPAKVTPPKTISRIELTAVTLADDCGGAAPSSKAVKAEMKAGAKGKAKQDAAYQRRCEQTSMQLSITAGDAGKIQIKSVELFDDAGKSLGTLTASKPTRWSDANGLYETWDETVAAGVTSSVSYVLGQPKFDPGEERWNRTYTLKTVLTVGGVDQTAQKDVTLTAPTTLPANVKT
jgi:hypothetical protein